MKLLPFRLESRLVDCDIISSENQFTPDPLFILFVLSENVKMTRRSDKFCIMSGGEVKVGEKTKRVLFRIDQRLATAPGWLRLSGKKFPLFFLLILIKVTDDLGKFSSFVI